MDRDDDMTIAKFRALWDDADKDDDDPPVGSIPMETILDTCEANRPERLTNPDPRMFSDLDNDAMSETLFSLWQAGIFGAEFHEGATRWWLTAFGIEIHDRGLIRQYADAFYHEEERREELPGAVRVLPSALPGGDS